MSGQVVKIYFDAPRLLGLIAWRDDDGRIWVQILNGISVGAVLAFPFRHPLRAARFVVAMIRAWAAKGATP